MKAKIPDEDIDWEAISVEYRCGVKSARTIGDEHGIDHNRIHRRAKRYSWSRDLLEKVRAETLAKLEKVRAETLAKLEEERSKGLVPQAKLSNPEKEAKIIDQTVDMQVSVVLDHRSLLARTREVVINLLSGLEVKTIRQEQLVELAQMMARAESNDPKVMAKMKVAYTKLLGVGADASILESLTRSLRAMIPLERQAYGIKEEDSGAETYEEQLKKLLESNPVDAGGRVLIEGEVISEN